MAAANPERSNTQGNVHLVDELENAFQNCVSILTSQEHFNVTDTEETKAGVEQSLQKFLDIARQLEAFFLHKRFIISKYKPEQEIKDNTEELKAELERKEQLIKRHQERLEKWQASLNSVNRGPGGGVPASSSQIQSQGQNPPGASQVIGGPQHPTQGMPNPAQMGMPNQQFQMNPQQASQMSQQAPPQMMMPRQGVGSGHQAPPHQPPPAYPQGPLAYLEQTMSSIGMPQDRR